MQNEFMSVWKTKFHRPACTVINSYKLEKSIGLKICSLSLTSVESEWAFFQIEVDLFVWADNLDNRRQSDGRGIRN